MDKFSGFRLDTFANSASQYFFIIFFSRDSVGLISYSIFVKKYITMVISFKNSLTLNKIQSVFMLNVSGPPLKFPSLFGWYY